VCSTFNTIQFKANSVPAIGLFDVVEHIENDHEFIQSIYEALEPNGKLYITVPAYQFLWSHSDIEAGHFRRYTQKSIRNLLIKHNFTVNYCNYFFGLLPPLIFMMRSIPWLLTKTHHHSRAQIKREHSQSTALVQQIFSKLLKLELSSLHKGISIPFGSSIMVVATKLTAD
jgi:hypothetical protein